MAIHDVVLDPDGDILVIVPGTLPGDLPSDPGPREPRYDQAEPQEEAIAVAEDAAAEQAAAEQAANNETSAHEEYSPDAPPPEGQWRFKASSKHLSLASTFVKKMMAGPWREANEIYDDGLRHWGFDGFDVQAISIILSVIHGLNRRIPRTVDLGMLAQIARVVDYLDCHEVMELYASIWVDHLHDSTSGSSREDWDSWISITGVFQNPAIFQSWTRVAIVEKLNYPPSLELPLLSQAYDIIDQRRQLHLDKIISSVYDHVDRLSEQKTCSAECDAILLGILIRQMRANSLPNLRPTRPYEGLSVSSIVTTIKSLSVPKWYSEENGADEPSQSPFDFWGAPKKLSKLQQKRAQRKAKKRTSPHDGWGQFAESVEEIEEVLVMEHTCGFDKLIAEVISLEMQIEGLDLKKDLGIRHSE
ncbi:hypothetical protein F4859DRAFT_513158 [Xylaria cf. heliscus]|nr:hypothetical protein F4859DRAFT_513158 [Xylaria cf. heliscus]